MRIVFMIPLFFTKIEKACSNNMSRGRLWEVAGSRELAGVGSAELPDLTIVWK